MGKKIQQQTFLQPSLFTAAKRSSAIFATGEARRVETQARSMFGCWWRGGRCEKDKWLCSLQTRSSTKTLLRFTFQHPPPPAEIHTKAFSLQHECHDSAHMDTCRKSFTNSFISPLYAWQDERGPVTGRWCKGIEGNG